MMKSLPPNNFGNKSLVEQCEKVKISSLCKKYKEYHKKSFLKAKVNILGTNVSLTTTTLSSKGKKVWFRCPLCNKRMGVIYKHPLNNLVGCRTCLNLVYKKRRYKNMIEERCLK